MSQERIHIRAAGNNKGLSRDSFKASRVEIVEYRLGLSLRTWGGVKDVIATSRQLKEDLHHNPSLSLTTQTAPTEYTAFAPYDRGPKVQTCKISEPPPWQVAHAEIIVGKLRRDSRPLVKTAVSEDNPGFKGDTKRTIFAVTPIDTHLLFEITDDSLNGDGKTKYREQRLASLLTPLGIEQGIPREEIRIAIPQRENIFYLDFDQLADRLQPLFTEQPHEKLIKNATSLVKRRKTLGERLVTYLSNPQQDRFVLGKVNNLVVSLAFDGLGDRLSSDGHILTGPLVNDPANPSQIISPRLILSVHRPLRKDPTGVPIIFPLVDPDMTKKARTITQIIKNLFIGQ